MAYVLALRPHSPLKRSFSDNPYLNSCSPLKETSLAPLSDITARNASACSLYTLGSNKPGDWCRGNENTPPLTSQSLLDLVPVNNGNILSIRHIIDEPRKRTCGLDRPPPSFSRATAPSDPHSRSRKVAKHVPEPSPSSAETAEVMDIVEDNLDESDIFNLYEAIRVPLPEGRFSDNAGNVPQEQYETVPSIPLANPQPFKRWMSTLRRRHVGRKKGSSDETSRLTFSPTRNNLLGPLVRQLPASVRRTSESMSSSMGGVTAIKSASITIAGTSIAPPSEAGMIGRVRLGNRSSNYSDARRSLESHRGALGPVIDESAWLRSLQRRKVVEELIASEESYIADLKVLINVRTTCLL